jgi:hypothetical protein
MFPAIVEWPLVLSGHQAEALVALSERRKMSVGQLLRDLIDRATDELNPAIGVA